jgi:DNA topoisomerase-3
LKEVVKGTGLGTPATRAGIIEALLQRDYIARKDKVLIPTTKGATVYSIVANKDISSVMMTAQWEAALEKIEAGTYSSTAFQSAIEDYTRKMTMELLHAQIVTEDVPELLCPKCKNRKLLINEKVIKCPEQTCGWLQYRTVCGVVLTPVEITNLVQTGQTTLIKGMRSKSGKLFNARLVLDNHSKVAFEFA